MTHGEACSTVRARHGAAAVDQARGHLGHGRQPLLHGLLGRDLRARTDILCGWPLPRVHPREDVKAILPT